MDMQSTQPHLEQSPVPQEPVPSVIKTPPAVKHSAVPLILIVLLILLLSVCGFLVYQNQTLKNTLTQIQNPADDMRITPTLQTTDVAIDSAWKQIKRQLWEFRVPNTWNYLECSDTVIFAGDTIDKDQTIDCAFDGEPGAITISRHSDPRVQAIPELTSKDPIVTQRTTISVGGKSAIMQLEEIIEGQGAGKRWVVYVSTPKYLDVISLHKLDEKDIFDQILKTFVFTEKDPIIRPTETPTAMVLRGTSCPVTFTIPPEVVQSWQLRNDVQRFFYVPRAEEINGKRTTLGLNNGNGEVGIAIGCQDNPNKWNMNDFKQYILRADEMKDRIITDVHMWDRDVFQLTYTTTWDTNPVTYTLWLFSTPNMLISVSKINGNYDSVYSKDIDTILKKGISFSL